MTSLRDTVAARLGALEAALGRPPRYLLALSGGLDSTALLHILAERRGDVPLEAVHVDHRLQPESSDWARQACAMAADLGVRCHVETVLPDLGGGKGVEGAARESRYAALAALMQEGDWLLSAHHRDDQVETLFLNLLRGSGPDGLAAMPEVRRVGPGWLVRPLLDVSRAALASYAADADLEWIEDPSNAALGFDRNYLRHEVLPRITDRWPDAVARFARSIERQQEASELLDALGAADIERLGTPERLDVPALLALSPGRRRNALRAAVRRLGLPMPPRSILGAIEADLLPAREDAEPLVAWSGAEARRYRGRLFLMPGLAPPPAAALAFDDRALGLPAGLGTLRLEAGGQPGLKPDIAASGLSVRWREGGEALRVAKGGPTRSLKKLLQEASIVPWMRDRMPLVYAGDTLVAVADRFIAADAQASPGLAIRWLDHPAVV